MLKESVNMCDEECDRCRSALLQAASNEDQTLARDPRNVNMDVVFSENVLVKLSRMEDDGATFGIEKSGAYSITFAAQVSTLSKHCPSQADFWLDVNGEAVPLSTVRVRLSSGASKDSVTRQLVMRLKKGDKLSVMASGENGIFMDSSKCKFAPTVPSVSLTMFKL